MCECKHENPSLFLSCGICDRIKNSENISVIDLMGPDEADSEIREATPAGHATNMPDGEDSGIGEATSAGHATTMDWTRDYLGPRCNGAAAGGASHTPAGHATNNRSEYAQRLLKKKKPNCPNCRTVFEENEDFFDEDAN
jgi:hypothetical protein